MPIRQPQYPVRFSPRGLVDAWDATDMFPGACGKLENLMFDGSNPELMVARPGVIEITDFTGISNPGVISVHITVGRRTYGMIDSDLNVGDDQPFCYDHDAAAFVAISGITAANSPTTQSTAGAWNPPTMAVIGAYIIVTHPGFPGGASKFGVIDITTPATPVWSATDTATNNLAAVPTGVSNYRNRAWFIVGNDLEFTDVLDPLTRTNATQVLTVGDAADLTVLSGLPIQTTSSGITAALLAFKDTQVWQITGDAADSNLALNFLSLTVGCPAPRSVSPAPFGVYFASHGGPYIVDALGVVRPVLHSSQRNEPDLHASYGRMVEPTRVAAAYANNVYRICMESVRRGVTDDYDFWFYEHRRRWCGPHTFAYHCVQPLSNYFVLSSDDAPGQLFRSDVSIPASNTYTDDGAAYNCLSESAQFPKTGQMEMNQVVESTIELGSAGSDNTFTVRALDEQDNQIGVAYIPVDGEGVAWGDFVWGDGTLYANSEGAPEVYDVNWTDTLIFKKAKLEVSAVASSGLSIGTFFARYQNAGFTLPARTSDLDLLATEDGDFIAV